MTDQEPTELTYIFLVYMYTHIYISHFEKDA